MTARNTDPVKKVTWKSGETRYRFVIDMGEKPDGRRDQRCFTFKTLKEARTARAKIISDRQAGTLVKRDKTTFDDLCQRWLDSRHDVREVTHLGYIQILKPVRAQLGRIKVQDLNRSHIERLIKSLRDDRRLSHRTCVYTLGAIRQVLAYGISSGLIGVNVAASVKAPRKQHGDTRAVTVWSPAELVKFRNVSDQDEWAAGWRLTLCGLRRSEVLGMRWDAVDLDRGDVVVRAGRVLLDGKRTATDDPKSSASHRTVPVEDIQPGTVALLRSLKARQAADRLVSGVGYRETGYVLVDPLREPIKPLHLLGPVRVPMRCRGGAGGSAAQCSSHVGDDHASSWPGTGRCRCPAGAHGGGAPVGLRGIG
jgi:integrase